MICATCRAAADATPDGLMDFDRVVQALHEKCKGGTWCDCQHRKSRVSITLDWDAGQIIYKVVDG